ELGAVEVRIHTEDDRTSISFSAQTSSAREAIEASLPRLRELLAGGGLQLAHSEVSQQNAHGEQPAFGRASPRDSGTEPGTDDTVLPPPRSVGLGLVDHYV